MSGTFAFSGTPITAEMTTVLRMKWDANSLAFNVNGTDYGTGGGVFPPASSPLVKMGFDSIGGGGPEMVGIDYLDIVSAGSSGSTDFWTGFRAAQEKP